MLFRKEKYQLFKLKKHPQQSIKDKMLRLVALTSIIPNLVLGVFAIFLILQTSSSNVDQQLIANANMARDMIADQIGDHKNEFEFWFRNKVKAVYPTYESLKASTLDIEVSMYQFVGNKQNAMSIYLLFEDSFYIGTKKAPVSYTLPSFLNWGIFNDLKYENEVIFHGGLDNSEVMTKAYSIGTKVSLNDGTIAYAILDVAPAFINNFLNGLKDTAYGVTSFVLVNSNNIILYSDLPLNRDIKIFSEELLEKKNEIKTTHDFVHDITYYASFQRTSLTNETIGLSLLIGTSILFAGLISFYNGVRLSKDLSQPIMELTDEIHSYQEIDKRDTKPINKNELEELRIQFQILMKQRQQSISEILEKQELLKEAEFKFLSSQIQPHFLYNTLESIKWKAKLNETEDIVLMVSKLGEILKASMDLSASIVTIQQELRNIDAYLQIQKLRYGDRITSIVLVEEPLNDLKIPKLILQPIVENAIIHGLEPLAYGGIIEIYGWLSEDSVNFTVFDNGVGSNFDFDEYINSNEPKSIGLVNVDRRLKLYFGDNYKMTWESTKGVGTIVYLKFPRKDVIEDV